MVDIYGFGISKLMNRKKESKSIDYNKIIKEREKKDIEEEKKDYSPRYKCDFPTNSVNGYIEHLKNNNYKKGIKKWNIWFPQGYNDIDNKLKSLKILNDEQIIFAIPNCDSIVSKYNVWKSLENYYGRKEASSIIPESFLLDDKEQLNKIPNTTLILKKKKQRKEGLKITSDIDYIKEKSVKDDFLIAQKMITPPFLVNNRKINLRIYMMLTLHKNILNVYFNNYGTCIYTRDEYKKDSTSFETNITSYKLDMDIYKDNPLTLEQLKTYMKDNGLDHEELFNRIKFKIYLFINAMKDQLGNNKYKNNLCCQVFGLDFIIDSDMEPFLLECNKGPEMKPKITYINDPDNITNDMLEIIEDLKNVLSNGESNIEKIKKVKNSYNKLYKGYPKILKSKTILSNIEEFYKKEEKLNSYPCGYKTGNGLKVQKDALNLIGLIDNDNNGFEKIKEFN